MTISTTISRKVYSGNGSTTDFPTTFPFFEAGDLRVTLVESDGTQTVQTLTTHYTVSGGDGSTGTVTMLTAPASGESLVIERVMGYVQELQYPAGTTFPSSSTEDALDKVVMLIQQLLDKINRSIQLPITSSLSDIHIPEPGASEIIRWNAAGTDLETVALADLDTSLDVVLTSIATNDILVWNGSEWVNQSDLILSNLEVAGVIEVTGAIEVAGVIEVAGAIKVAGAIEEGIHALSGTTPALDPANGTIQTWTLTANSSPTDSLAAGESITIMIDDGSAFTITWPTMQWAGGFAPTLATSGYTVVELWKVGSTLYGAAVGEMS